MDDEEAPNPHSIAVSNKGGEKRMKAKEDRCKRALALLLSTQDGRELMYDWIAFCGAYTDPAVPGDPHMTYRGIGQQNVGRMLIASIPPRVYAEMLTEAGEGLYV